MGSRFHGPVHYRKEVNFTVERILIPGGKRPEGDEIRLALRDFCVAGGKLFEGTQDWRQGDQLSV